MRAIDDEADLTEELSDFAGANDEGEIVRGW